MVTKHTGRYWVGKDNFYHFETEGDSVIIYDNSGNQIGTLDDLMFKGKVVTGVSFKTIIKTGVYNVKNMEDLPNTIPTDKTSILSVIAVGNNENPDLIEYKIIGSNGVISECTAIGSTYTSWTTGGVSLDNAISTINTTLTALNSKITNTNSSLLGTNQTLSNLSVKFDGHNHDGRYLLKSGDTAQGNIGVKYGSGFRFMRSNGANVNLANVDSNDKFTLGDNSVSLGIASKDDVKINGHKIYTDANSGQGSGINADMIDGIESSLLLRNDKVNQVNADFELENGSEIRLMPNGNNSTDLYGRLTASGGGLVAGVKGHNVLGIYQDQIWSNSKIVINGQDTESYYQFAGSNDDHIGFYYNDSRHELGVYDWGRNQYLMAFTKAGGDGIVDIPSAPRIQGRRLFLTNDTPTGNIPYGSVWIGF
ncbi:hypothetical protein [Liquorilactobacillus hordei]|uniref:Uncharacterized protein n=1 Tax=Liquorilactobacillus hordei DSM 19519 TaxID=1423759 RepID=A0A0R1MS18_9LACO|nr:hypothetical protein [Liquorilactobacillus hordei]KRL07941.1 hypothetical protein FC92_GL001008 [Liquorilactobacillus hordei DSM 19519]QYH51114.1 hypothetical protein G6O70_00715 [Liquorilactobacillus hordei DSM 19519]